LATVVCIYTTWISIWFALWLVVRDGWWWLALLNRVAVYMFVPVPLMALLAVANRLRWVVGTALLPPLIFGALFWPYVIPRRAHALTGSTLRVMTYNVLYSNTDYNAVAGIIQTYQPDLIALQEVQPEMMEALIERLGTAYPYFLMGTEHPYGTTAAFSRYPVQEAYILDLTYDRPAVVLNVNVRGEAVTFISAHLLAYGLEWVRLSDVPKAVTQRVHDQEYQAGRLIDEIQQPDRAAIVACDCNSQETAGAYRLLAQPLTNAARAVGWAIGPLSLSGAHRDTDVRHFDYVLYRGSLEAVEVDTVQDFGGSDHLPVIALLSLN
jgi:endonuclease/exonuclease/phosphatase (EEP) superfamily protein YafD